MIDVIDIINEVDGIPKLSLQEKIIQSIVDTCKQHVENRELSNFTMGIDTTSSKISDTIFLKIYPTSKFKSFIIDSSRKSYKALLKGIKIS